MTKKEEREEDSGLHDIRNLAQSTKQRLSKRISTSPISDEDALASASGSWKNIALPQPAKMVSLPELADLPTKADVLAAEKSAKAAAVAAREAEKVAKEAEKAAKKAGRDSKKDIAEVAAAPAAPVAAPAAAPAAAVESAVPAKKAFSLPSQREKTSKGPIFAIAGLAVAAAAGGVIYMQMSKKSEEPAPQVAAAPAKVEVTTTPIEPAVAPPPPAETAAAGSAVEEPPPVAQIAAPAEEPKKDEDKEAKAKKAPKVHTVEIVDEGKKQPEKPVQEKKPAAAPAKGSDSGEGEPSFDELLKEAGVDQTKKEKKPVLDKKELSGGDFKKGMSAVAANAKACYSGTQGIAMMKMIISPDGKVEKVTITGAFAGKPEADCVSNAVKAASFPPWDGGPQTFNYSYMLAE